MMQMTSMQMSTVQSPMLETLLLLLHAGSTLWMVGLIWFVQIVHYPLMSRVGHEQWVEYERAHQQRTTLVVGPPMLIELITAIAVLAMGYTGVIGVVGLILVLINWLSTALLQVPCHQQLEKGFDAQVHQRLVRTNWIRTVAWSMRGVLALLLLTVAN